jgi:mannose-6-phosphate isomerase-like protein (cupin superfamily)
MRLFLALAASFTMAILMTADAATGGVPASVHFISHEKVAQTMAKGGAIIEDPGLRVLANRRGPAGVELHEHTNHIFIIVEGDAVMVTGGKMVDPKRTEPDQMRATSIDGGQVHHLTKGDVITIPSNTPHWWKEISSGTVAYYAVNIEQ